MIYKLVSIDHGQLETRQKPACNNGSKRCENPIVKNIKRIAYVAFALLAGFAYAEIQFTRITNEAGIQFRHFNGATGEKHLVETMGGGAAFFDYDYDDDLDLYFVNGAPLTGGSVCGCLKRARAMLLAFWAMARCPPNA